MKSVVILTLFSYLAKCRKEAGTGRTDRWNERKDSNAMSQGCILSLDTA